MAKRYKKRKDGRYATNVTVGRDYNTGNPIIVKVYGTTIEELENNKAIVKSDYLKGNNIITKKVIFHDYASRWLALKKPYIANKTYDMYASILKLHVGFIDDRDMKTIIKFDIQNLINQTIDKPRTCKKIQVTLNQIFESALQDNVVNRNPCKGITLPKYKPKEKRHLTPLEDYLSDITEFTDREKAFILLLKWCGFRKEEALALRKDDFSIKKRIVTVNHAVEFIHNQPYLKSPKSDAGYRDLPLLDQCFSFISYYLSTLNTPYLFSSLRSGELISEQSYKKMWESIIKKMNMKVKELGYNEEINTLTPHIFRHNYACMLEKADIPLKERQYLMGHSSIVITMDTYTHTKLEDMRAPLLLDNYFKNNPPKLTPN